MIVLILRVYTRAALVKSFGYDDAMMILAWVRTSPLESDPMDKEDPTKDSELIRDMDDRLSYSAAAWSRRSTPAITVLLDVTPMQS